MKKLNKKKKGQTKPKINEGSYSFVVGNGTSRKDLDLTQIKDYGTLIACNWFFKKEFHPDILVCSDEPITRSMFKVHEQYVRNKHFYTWFPKPGKGSKKPACPEKFSAGGLSTFIACDVVKSKKVFLIGMDFFGFGSQNKMSNGKLNNMYEGEKHYLKPQAEKENPAPTYRNWQRRFEWIMRNFPNVDFYHVNPFDGKSPERLRGLPNFHQVTWDNLNDHINNDVELVDILEKTEEDLKLIVERNEDDLRASIERQLAGQNNSIMMDPLHPEQVLDIRRKAADYYRKNGVDKGHPMISIGGFDIMLPTNFIREGNISRSPTDKELKAMWQREYSIRYTKKAEDGASIPNTELLKKGMKAPKQPSMPPPPPPTSALPSIPPPPPPMSMV